ncbi:peptidoglycan-binding domain-containing protein [Azospirillum canadense]|uniref:peptidoglycan-binding domain-containing protein n=1 Tax=Azospirillum canadense TaxID=403962 RepID=UPI002227E813|nr:peptidoglycan-binding domain-containing protein [Azospirillum canadense]MCW2237526.1 peptidoglycan hydrolase-like protein with peptidoglycan-binding domain [Azospirillum canadense]
MMRPAMARSAIAACFALTAFAAAPAFAVCPDENMPSDMRYAYVQGAQSALNEHGFKAGTADGKMGPNTRTAVRAYQKAAKLPVDGCVTKELLDHLNFAQPKVYAPGKR